MIQDKIFEEIKKILVAEFEIDEKDITMDADLRQDLNLDSIDAIDLCVKMKEYIPANKGNIDPAILRTVRTMRDVVDALVPYLSDEAPAASETKDPSGKAEN